MLVRMRDSRELGNDLFGRLARGRAVREVRELGEGERVEHSCWNLGRLHLRARPGTHSVELVNGTLALARFRQGPN